MISKYLARIREQYAALDLRDLPGAAAASRANSGELLELYVPPRLKRRADDDESADTDDEYKGPGELLKKHRRVVIVGEPGGGKTTLLHYLALRCASARPLVDTTREDGGAQLLPVLVSLARAPALRETERELAIEELLRAHLDQFGGRQLRGELWPLVERGLDRGDVLLLLDGLDEIFTRHVEFAKALEHFTLEYPEARFVATARPHGAVAIRGAPQFELERFSNFEIRDFLRRRERSRTPHARHEADDRADKIFWALRREENLLQLARTPLMLILIALAEATRPDCVPARRVELFERAIMSLLAGRRVARQLDADARRRVFTRWSRASLQLAFKGRLFDDLKTKELRAALLRALDPSPDAVAAAAEVDALLEAAARDHGLLTRLESGDYRFWHRALAEFLAAWAAAHALPSIETLVKLRDAPDDARDLFELMLEVRTHRFGDDELRLDVAETIAFARRPERDALSSQSLRLAAALLLNGAAPPAPRGARVLGALATRLRQLPDATLETSFIGLARHLPVDPKPPSHLVRALLAVPRDGETRRRAELHEELARRLQAYVKHQGVPAALEQLLSLNQTRVGAASKAARAYAAIGLLRVGRSSATVLQALISCLDPDTRPGFEGGARWQSRARSRTDLTRQVSAALSGLSLAKLAGHDELNEAERRALRVLTGEASQALVAELYTDLADPKLDKRARLALTLSGLEHAVTRRHLVSLALDAASSAQTHQAQQLIETIFAEAETSSIRGQLWREVLKYVPRDLGPQDRRLQILTSWTAHEDVRDAALSFITAGHVALDPQPLVALAVALDSSLTRVEQRDDLWKFLLEHDDRQLRVEAALGICLRSINSRRKQALSTVLSTLREELDLRLAEHQPGDALVQSSVLERGASFLELLSHHHEPALEGALAKEEHQPLAALLTCALVCHDPERLARSRDSLRATLHVPVLALKRRAIELLFGERGATATSPFELQGPVLECIASVPEHRQPPPRLAHLFSYRIAELLRARPLARLRGPLHVIGVDRLWLDFVREPKLHDPDHPIAKDQEFLSHALSFVDAGDATLRHSARHVVLIAAANPAWRAHLYQQLERLPIATAVSLAHRLIENEDTDQAPLLSVLRRAQDEEDGALRHRALETLWPRCGEKERLEVIARHLERSSPELSLRCIEMLARHRYSRANISAALVGLVGLPRLRALLRSCLELASEQLRLFACALMMILEGDPESDPEGDAEDDADKARIAATLHSLSTTPIDAGRPSRGLENLRNVVRYAFRSEPLSNAYQKAVSSYDSYRVDRAAALLYADRHGGMTARLRASLLDSLASDEHSRWTEAAVSLWAHLQPTSWRDLLDAAEGRHRTLEQALTAAGPTPRDVVERLIERAISPNLRNTALQIFNLLNQFVDADAALIEDLVAPYLRRQFFSDRPPAERLSIVHTMLLLKSVPRDDVELALRLGELFDASEYNIAVGALHQFIELPLELRLELIPRLLERASAGRAEGIWLVEYAYYDPATLPFTARATLMRALVNRAELPRAVQHKSALALLTLDPDHPDALAALVRCLQAQGSRDELNAAVFSAMLLRARGHDPDALRETLERVCRDDRGAIDDRLLAAQLLLVHFNARDTALTTTRALAARVFAQELDQTYNLSVIIGLASAAGETVDALVPTLISALVRVDDFRQRTIVAMLLRAARGESPYPPPELPSDHRLMYYWDLSASDNALKAELEGVDKKLSPIPEDLRELAAYLARPPLHERLADLLRPALAQLIEADPDRLHLARSRGAVAQGALARVLTAVRARGSDRPEQRFARAWFFAQVNTKSAQRERTVDDLPAERAPEVAPARTVTLDFSCEDADTSANSERRAYQLRVGRAPPLRFELVWSREFLERLYSLQDRRSTRPPAAARTLGDALRAAIGPVCERIDAAIEPASPLTPVRLTIRATAELCAIPFELIPAAERGPLGLQAGVSVRYQLPRAPPREPAAHVDEHRVLMAWTSLHDPVIDHELLDALTDASNHRLCFNPSVDALDRASLESIATELTDARALGRDFSVLQLVCHGKQRNLVLHATNEPDIADEVDGARLAEALRPFASTLQLVILCVCNSADSIAHVDGSGSVAQALHEVGIRTVLASRGELSYTSACTLTKKLYAHLRRGLDHVDEGLTAARRALHDASEDDDWLTLQLYARDVDVDE